MKTLIVDDEQVVAEITGNSLVVSGLTTWNNLIFAANGMEALEWIEQEHPELIITDVVMPKMDGLQLITEIRNQNIETPIIMITAHSNLDAATMAIRLGVSELLRKPYEREELIYAVRKIIEKISLKKENEEYKKKVIQAEKFISLGIMAAGLSHEINNPMTFIRINLELLEQRLLKSSPQLDQATHENLMMAIQGCDRITAIVSGLLAYSRNSGDKKTKVTAKTLIHEAMRACSHKINNHAISVPIKELSL